MADPLIPYLLNFITDSRKAIFEKILAERTRYITVVLEDIFQSHNASAVLRTCDCFGIQDIHLIENNNKFSVNVDIALGSEKWLSLHKYAEEKHNTLAAINKLKRSGYRIVATTPHRNDVNLNDFDLNKGKVALLFGTELRGLSEIALNNADEFLKIPMFGFTESFNISVTAGIVLHMLSQRMRNSGIEWKLGTSEAEEVLLSWLKRSINNSDLIEKEFLSRQNKSANILKKK